MRLRSLQDVAKLAADYRTLEQFGPNTDNPFLVVDVIETPSELAASYLSQLPCPVIGIGSSSFIDPYDVVLPDSFKLAKLCQNITNAPIAAMILVQHLRASQGQNFHDALIAESLAYGVAQSGPEFKNWLTGNTLPPAPHQPGQPLSIEVKENVLNITLTQAENRNAVNVVMRDALCEALDVALLDHAINKICLTGSGPVFSTGGDVTEFGSISDSATAHHLRTLRQPAHRLAKLREKLNIHVNGAAIGAGLEMAAFGTSVTASSQAWFQLPELKYGLIPGAGGTVSVTNRIGRHKTAYLALSMDRIRATKALEWGLIDAIEDR